MITSTDEFKSRFAKVERSTNETQAEVELSLDENVPLIDIDTGFGMLDHMLSLIAFWAGISINVKCIGDLHVDAHHTIEDVGICIGTAINDALGDHVGIYRIGYGRVPMDEALTEITIDISGRPWIEWRGDHLLPPVIAGEESDVWREFYKAIASHAKMNLHVEFLYGKNGHHLLESAAKGFGMALSSAISIRGNMVRSTKGSFD